MEKSNLVSVRKEKPSVLSGLTEEERRIHLEFSGTEKYLSNFSSQNDFKELIKEAGRILKAIDSLHKTSLELLKTNISAYTQLNIDQRLWKVSVHDVVTLGRHASANHSSLKLDIKSSTNLFLEKAIVHFEEVVQWIESKYPYTRNICNGKAEYAMDSGDSNFPVARLLARVQISLGDTLRYCAANNPDALRQAMEVYEKVRGTDPANGRTYHQMGVVALIRKDVLSAVYDFTRAYCSPVPVEAAKQQLYIVFDEAFKMYNPASSTYWYSRGKRLEELNLNPGRRQIWVFSQQDAEEIPPPDEAETMENHLKQFSSSDLSRRFCITYVQVIGKLFTGIGLETLHVVAEEALVYLEGLLARGNTSYFPPLRIIQVMTMNIHILDHLRPKSKTDASSWVTGVQFAMEVFSVIVERLSRLIDLCDWDDPQMDVLTAGLQTWVEWMKLNPKDWSRRRPRPPFSIRRILETEYQNLTEREDDVWKAFSSLMTKLEVILIRFPFLFPSVSRETDERHKFCISPFPESKHMFGFVSFANAQMLNRKYYSDDPRRGISRGRNFVRLRNIHKFGVQILSEKCSILEYKVLNGVREFSTQVKVKKTESEVGGVNRSHYHFWLKDFNERLNVGQNQPEISHPSPASQNSQIYELWLHLTTKGGFATEIIVQPCRFVLDTNCFVWKLGLVKALLSLALEPLFVPVTVILELKGLAKGGLRPKDKIRFASDNSSKLEKQEKIIDGMERAESCKLALSFISDYWDYFRIITSTGNILSVKSPYAFVADDYFDSSMKNDDRILDACKYLEARDSETRALDTSLRIYRKTVLVSGDRWIRIKALECDIPARPLNSIIFWLACHHFPQLNTALLNRSKEDREKRKQFHKLRKYNRDKRNYKTYV